MAAAGGRIDGLRAEVTDGRAAAAEEARALRAEAVGAAVRGAARRAEEGERDAQMRVRYATNHTN